MENYTYPPSYADSGDSSPRSREIDFENPPSWEDPQNPTQSSVNYKVKFMCSYGGKINPRPHDNQLSYMGGETKILSVDRGIKFASLVAKLAVLCENDGVSFKYQLPGEELDALISVTNDDDLEHMMHEYDRLFRASPKPTRLRLFLFLANPNPPPLPPSVVGGARSFGSDEGIIKPEKERLVEALNSGPIQATMPSAVAPPPPPQAGNVDFLFGLEKGVAPPPIQPPPIQQPPPPPAVVAVRTRDPIADHQALHEHEIPAPGLDERAIGSDPIQKHIQDLQRLRIEEQQGMAYRKTNDDNLAGGYPSGGEYYVQKVPERIAPVSVPGSMPIPTGGYWPEKHISSGGVFQANAFGTDHPVYVIPAPAGAYNPQIMRPVTGPAAQGGYYVYREQQQPPYNVAPQQMGGAPVQSVAAAPPSMPPPHEAPTKIPAPYSETYGMVWPATTGGVVGAETGYVQLAYDSGVGRQVYYAASGGVSVGVTGGPPQAAQHQQQGQ